jgi:hypothetical protein
VVLCFDWLLLFVFFVEIALFEKMHSFVQREGPWLGLNKLEQRKRAQEDHDSAFSTSSFSACAARALRIALREPPSQSELPRKTRSAFLFVLSLLSPESRSSLNLETSSFNFHFVFDE